MKVTDLMLAYMYIMSIDEQMKCYDYGEYRLPKTQFDKIQEEFISYCKRNQSLTISDVFERVQDKKRNPFSKKTAKLFLENYKNLESIMTNKEKAEIIAHKTDCRHRYYTDAVASACIAMAEWKDEKYKVNIDKLNSQISILETQIKLLKFCDIEKSILAQEYRRGFDDALKQSKQNEKAMKAFCFIRCAEDADVCKRNCPFKQAFIEELEKNEDK